MQLPGFELPDTVALAQSDFDAEVAKTLEGMADRFADKLIATNDSRLEDALAHLEHTVQAQRFKDAREGSQTQLETLLKLSRNTEQLLTSLNREI